MNVNYTQAFGSSNSPYNYGLLSTNLRQTISLGNKGDFQYNISAGKFFNASEIAFMDYKHFNGNEVIAVVSKPYIESFLILPYYDYSTNKNYFESHLKHNFNGFIMNKIPLLNELRLHLNVGHNFLATGNRQYHELTAGFSNIGWGKYRIFKIDFVRSYNIAPNSRKVDNGFVVGLSF